MCSHRLQELCQCPDLSVAGMEDSTKYNDRRMSTVGSGPFKASTQKKTVRSLDTMIPAVDQWLGRSGCVRSDCSGKWFVEGTGLEIGWLRVLLLFLLFFFFLKQGNTPI